MYYVNSINLNKMVIITLISATFIINLIFSFSYKAEAATTTTMITPRPPQTTSDILIYQNSSYGIRIQYPANWTKDEGDFDPNDDITDIVEFSSPFENRSESDPEILHISIEGFTDKNTTLDGYANSVITYYKETLTNFNLVESDTNNSTLAGRPAYKLVYTNVEDDTNYKTMEIGTIIGDKVYYIEYIAEEEKYSNYLPTIQMMINSFEITQ